MVKVRFAPSPTGKLHLGSARTAIYNWLYARHCGGKFVLRIEDTDLSRSSDEYTQSIVEDMKWLGMTHDEFYKQSERFDIYRSYVDKLLAEGKAYYCTCTKDELVSRNRAKGIMDEATKYDGHCRGNLTKPEGPHVIRLDVGPERDIIFADAVRKRIRVNTKELDDFVLWKSDGSPTYNFAVVIDDATMEISHIIRGEDHITNTAKQIILYEYFGFPQPVWAHLPMVFGKDHAPLSKRKGSTNVEDYRKRGVLPGALINYIARLGWSFGNEEIFTIESLIEKFDIDRLNKSNAVYDEDKMFWVNGKHIRMAEVPALEGQFDTYLASSGRALQGRMTDRAWLSLALDVLRERNDSLEGIYDEMLAYALDEFGTLPEAEEKFGALSSDPANLAAFEAAAETIRAAGTNYDALEEKLRAAAEANGAKFGSVVQMLRIALCGKTVSPDIVTVVKLLGSTAAKRLDKRAGK